MDSGAALARSAVRQRSRSFAGRVRRLGGGRTTSAAISLACFLAIWELYARLQPGVFLPPFSVVVEAWLRLAGSGTLLEAVSISVQALGIGFGLALVTGILLGLLMGLSETADRVLSMYVNALLAVPSVAYIVLLLLWFGTGLTARTAIVFEYAVLIIAVNTTVGVKTVDRSLVEMGRSFRLSRRALLTKVILPGALPAISAGVRLGIGRAVKGMINSEMLLVLVGMGGLIKYYGSSFRVDLLLAMVITVVMIALLLTASARWIEAQISGWAPARVPR